MKRIIVLTLFSLTIFCGCGKKNMPAHQGITGNADENGDSSEYNLEDDADSSSVSWSASHDTAPMPEKVVEEEDLIGYWSPDTEAEEPDVIEFYREDGILKYRYFSVLMGNGNGLAIGKEHTVFEYNAGNVSLQGNQGTCSCQVGESAKAYISFYCMDSDMKTIVDQEDGTVFYRWDEFAISE